MISSAMSLKKWLAVALLVVGVSFGWSAVETLPKGPPPGIVVVESPEPGRIRVASPSIIRHSNGDLMVSHDWYGRGGARTSVYRSGDKGDSWQRLADVPGVMWATLFEHDDGLYLFRTSGGVSDVVLRRSQDGGRTWSEAWTGAQNYHDANYITFHRVENFRSLK
jgi:hypothetical protein